MADKVDFDRLIDCEGGEIDVSLDYKGRLNLMTSDGWEPCYVTLPDSAVRELRNLLNDFLAARDDR